MHYVKEDIQIYEMKALQPPLSNQMCMYTPCAECVCVIVEVQATVSSISFCVSAVASSKSEKRMKTLYMDGSMLVCT